MAPRNAATLEALQGRRFEEPMSAIPREVMDFQPTSPLQLDSKAFAKCAGSPVWLFSRPWEMHKRDAPRLFGRSRVAPVVVLRQRRFSQRNSSANGGRSVDGGHHDSIAETRREGRGGRSEESQLAWLSGGSSPSVWHDSLPRLWNRSVPHSSSLYSQEREQIAWSTSTQKHRANKNRPVSFASSWTFEDTVFSKIHENARLAREERQIDGSCNDTDSTAAFVTSHRTWSVPVSTPSEFVVFPFEKVCQPSSTSQSCVI